LEATLSQIGQWLRVNGECVYGRPDKSFGRSSGVSENTVKGNSVYVWNWIWPAEGTMHLGGFASKLKSARILGCGEIEFEQEQYRITLKNMPGQSPGAAGVAVIALEFEKAPEFVRFPLRPPLNKGRIYI
jgi:alpha-L-fucosidase